MPNATRYRRAMSSSARPVVGVAPEMALDQRVLLPSGEPMPLHEEPVYFLRWELVTTARLYDALPAR
jgi:hypothetical protein